MQFQASTLIALFLHVLPMALGYSIEGTIIAPANAPSNWMVNARVHVDGSKYIGFVRPDGTFVVSGVSSGSYLVEFLHPVYVFQPARVDINAKGKIRSRRVNTLQTNAVKSLPYPLRVATLGKAMYFQPREQLRTLDLLLNPTVLIMVLPLLLVMVLPKLMDNNDPQLRDLQKMDILNNKNSIPDMSEILSSVSFLGSQRGPEQSPSQEGSAHEVSHYPAPVGATGTAAGRRGGKKRN